MKYNNFNMKEWKSIDINTDSLWIIKQRDKTVVIKVSENVFKTLYAEDI